MKAKAAVEKLSGHIVSLKEIHALYFHEVMSRVEMRAHGNSKVSVSLMKGVLEEMDDWIEKVCQGIGWSEADCRNAKAECRAFADKSMSLALRYGGEN